MTEFDLMDLIGEADDEYIMESRKRPQKQKSRWPVAIAAILALAVIGGVGALYFTDNLPFFSRKGAASAGTDQQVVMQAAEDTAPAAAEEAPAEAATEADSAALETEEAAEAESAEETAEEAAEETPEPAEPAEEAAEDAAVPEVPVEGGSYRRLAAAADPGSRETDSNADETEEETPAADPEAGRPSAETQEAVNAFSYALAAQVLRDGKESAAVSPLSLYQALAILTSGAEGETRDQLLSLLGQSDAETLAEEAGKLLRYNYTDRDGTVLKIANSLWLDEKDNDGEEITYSEDFLQTASGSYYADIYAADFAQPETGEALGLWVAARTNGLLRPDAAALGVDEDTLMTILNALYYKASWNENFDEADTAEGDFTTEDGQTQKAQFMHRTELSGRAVVTDEYTKAGLYTSTGRVIFVLPAEDVSVDDLLSEEKLWEVFENADYADYEVEWSVPKFQTDSDLDLQEALEALGVKEAFTDDAQFGKIADLPLKVSSVRQGTHIALNEEGVEAAAYSSIGMMAGSAAPADNPKVEMDLSRPFLYLITARDGSTLFLGVYRGEQQ